MYTCIDFKTKAELKRAVKTGARVTCFSPGPFECPTSGTIYLEGPHYPQPHRWYAVGRLENGALVSVK